MKVLILVLPFFSTIISKGQVKIYADRFPNSKGFNIVSISNVDYCSSKELGKNIQKLKLNIDSLGFIIEGQSKMKEDTSIIVSTKTDSHKPKSIEHYLNGTVKTEYFEQVYEYQKDNKTTLGFSKTDKKSYEYFDTLTLVKYFRDDKLLSIEKFIKKNKGKTLFRELTLLNGTIIKKINYCYDDKLRLVEVIGNETGKDGFGNTTDGIPFDKTIFKYDKLGKLVRKENIYQGKICLVEQFEYLK